jgi:hypothetical protein
MDTHVAHDGRGLFPPGGLQHKPGWEWDRDRHRTSQVAHMEALEAQHESSCHTVPEAHVAALARKLLQQGLRLLEVGGVKPFGEPAIDLRQELSGFITLALLLPQPTQVHRRP